MRSDELASVLNFWFEKLQPSDWFRSDAALDRQIAERFVPLHAAVAATVPQSAYTSSDDALAVILLLDQVPRNAFRGTPRAFATDVDAVRLATEIVALGLDVAMPSERRVFAYLPFEHSEDLADQDRAVALISALGDATYTQYAHAHRDVIQRFGRFPHRNASLGRISTVQEIAYLAQPGSGF